jgi:CheY-like chemotaxis protein
MKILIAEDNSDIALVYRVALQNRNHHVVITDNGEDCLTIYREELKNVISRMGGLDKQHVFDVVILDYKMPRMNGIEVAKEIIRINPKQRIIIVSAYVRETFFRSVKDLGQHVELVQKPFNIDTLIDKIESKRYRYEVKGLNQEASINNEFSSLSMRLSLPYTQLLYHRSHKTNSNNISQFTYQKRGRVRLYDDLIWIGQVIDLFGSNYLKLSAVSVWIFTFKTSKFPLFSA